MWMIILFCCFFACSASETPVSNLYMNALLQMEWSPRNTPTFEVPDFAIRGGVSEDGSSEASVVFTDGVLFGSGNFQRHGDCKGPVSPDGSAYIKCTVLLRGFLVDYRNVLYWDRPTAEKERVASLEAEVRDTTAKVEFRHVKGIQTEEVRVTVDEVRVHLKDLQPHPSLIAPGTAFNMVVLSKMNETLSNAVPEILADRLILAMDRVNFPLPK